MIPTTIYFTIAAAMAIFYAIRYREGIATDYSEYIASVCLIALFGPIMFVVFGLFFIIGGKE